MAATWTIKDSGGQLLLGFLGRSRLEVGRKVVATHYDPFRLEVSASYREVFDRDLRKVLERNSWQIVRLNRKSGRVPTSPTSHGLAVYPTELRAAA
jgi:hypothetical protein